MKSLNWRSTFAVGDVAQKTTRRVRSPGFASFRLISALFVVWGGLHAPDLRADTHTLGVPQLSSDPGAPYTIYLDFAGYNFTGTWGNSGETPGNTPAYNNVSATGTFGASDQTAISRIWARVAQCYTPFNVNVTTVDPAVAAARADTDAHRQTFYDQTPQLMHTVIGQQQNNWCGNYGGISYVGVSPWTYDTSGNGGVGNGYKTNWVFTDGVTDEVSRAQSAAHENGHGLNLSHQSDYKGDTLKNEYSEGRWLIGTPDYAPIMGAAYYSSRGAWRLGDANNSQDGHTQNDVSLLLTNYGIGGYVNDAIGHTLATATPMPLLGSNVNAALAKGIITPLSVTSPTPIGASNYSSDFFVFHSNGGPISLTVNDGSEFLNPGTADPGAMLRSTLTILNGLGMAVGTATEASSTLSETYSGTLPAGDYYAKIASYGGKTQTISVPFSGSYNTTYYYDIGSYFLTGSGLYPVPEPGTCVLLAAAAAFGIVFVRQARRSESKREAR
jgi:hypothetical protein